jgi:CDP-diacylglycerol--serine O-phosphatidyltransferase
MNDQPAAAPQTGPFTVRGRIKRLKTLPVLPTLLTAGNLASGITAIMCAAHATGAEHSEWLRAGAIMVFVAMVCDMLDGKVARMTRTDGAFGAELDSLSDVVCFGVAPAMLVHRLILGEPGVFDYGQRLLWFFTVFFPVMASIRLARYNVEHTSAPTPYFRGLPSPGAAALVCSWIIFYHHFQGWLIDHHLVNPAPYDGLKNLDPFGWSLLVISTLSALLMVSTVHYPHIGNTLLGRISFRKMILGLVFLGLVSAYPAAMLFLVTTGYVLWGFINGCIQAARAWQRGRDPLLDDDEEEADDAGLGIDKPEGTGPAHGR